MAKIPQAFIESLVSDTNIVEYIENDGIPLKKSGAEFRGGCPFHGDKNPSMDVNAEKGVYLCRSCGATGGVIKYIIDRKGMSFPDAVEELAKYHNRPMPKPDTSPQQEADEREKAELLSIIARAAAAYKAELAKSPDAQNYLKSRGVNSELAEKFGLGYSPSKNFLTSTLKDVPVKMLVKAGLVFESEFSPGANFEWMGARLVFPIRSQNGKTIAFGGRSLNPSDKVRKYVNTPETLVFKKGNEAYGAPEALASIRKTNTAVVTEGYLDVVIPSGAGFENIIAAMGTALNQVSIRRLFKSADNLIFCFDGDAAGQTAAKRALLNMLPIIDEKHSARFCFLPKGMDPDECVTKHGVEVFAQHIAASIPLSKFLIDMHASKQNMDEPEGRARFAVDAMADVNKIQAPFLRHVVADEIRRTIGYQIPLIGLNAPPSAPPPDLSAPGKRGLAGLNSTGAVEEPAQSAKPVSLAMRALSFMVGDPATAQYFEPAWLALTHSSDQEMNAVREVISMIKTAGPDVTKEMLLGQFKGSSISDVVHEAAQLDEKTIHADVYAQLSEFVNHLTEQTHKMTVVSSSIRKRLTH